MTDIAKVSKLLYFGNLFGYKRNLPQKKTKKLQFLSDSESKIEKKS